MAYYALRAVADYTRFAGPDLSEEEAYWLGFLFTDGCVSDGVIRLTLAEKDHDHVLQFARFLGSNREPKLRTYLNAKTRPIRETTTSRFALKSKPIVASLYRLGMHPNKTWTIKPWAGPDHLMRHFWRGCMDGDGCITRVIQGPTKRTTWGCAFFGNKHMVIGFQEFVFRSIGVRLYLTKRPPNKAGEVHFGVRNASSLATAKVARLLYDNCTVALERKAVRAAEVLAHRAALDVRPDRPTCATPGCDRVVSVCDRSKRCRTCKTLTGRERTMQKKIVANSGCTVA